MHPELCLFERLKRFSRSRLRQRRTSQKPRTTPQVVRRAAQRMRPRQVQTRARKRQRRRRRRIRIQQIKARSRKRRRWAAPMLRAQMEIRLRVRTSVAKAKMAQIRLMLMRKRKRRRRRKRRPRSTKLWVLSLPRTQGLCPCPRRPRTLQLLPFALPMSTTLKSGRLTQRRMRWRHTFMKREISLTGRPCRLCRRKTNVIQSVLTSQPKKSGCTRMATQQRRQISMTSLPG
mmetsp:Transcript_32261/g.77287  ORF Transcript_32261/g.77287 Transcript_32261/m.77287 type:complete len:231 (+) Transcript_32261:1776-2468(+)